MSVCKPPITTFLRYILFHPCTQIFLNRYLELVYPLWHKVHFKMRYLYMALAFSWLFGTGLNAAYMIPTGRVSSLFVRLFTPYTSGIQLIPMLCHYSLRLYSFCSVNKGADFILPGSYNSFIVIIHALAGPIYSDYYRQGCCNRGTNQPPVSVCFTVHGSTLCHRTLVTPRVKTQTHLCNSDCFSPRHKDMIGQLMVSYTANSTIEQNYSRKPLKQKL